MDLAAFNQADSAAAVSAATVWAAVPAWAQAVVAGRPYSRVEDAERAAIQAAQAWDADDLDAALAHHPRIGQRPVGTGAEAAASRREQAAVEDASYELASAIAEANADYEHRFGRVFLIRAAGRTPTEILAQARRRLANDDATETAEALEQLRQIAVLRLRGTLAGETE